MIEEINEKGMLNFLTSSQDFSRDTDEVSCYKFYCEDPDSYKPKYGVNIYFKEKEDRKIDVEIGKRAFLNLRTAIEENIQEHPAIHGILNSLCKFFEINVVMAYVPFYDNGFFQSYILFEKDSRYFCINARLSDILCLMRTSSIRVFVHNDIIESIGEEIEKKDNPQFLEGEKQ